MFTGLIQEVGSIAAMEQRGATRRVTVAAPQSSRTLNVGDSIAVSGVCLTAVKIDAGKSFAADLAQETLRRTSLSRIARGAQVNLELPMRSGEPLGGHIVQGHVDGVGQLIALLRAAEGAANNANRAIYRAAPELAGRQIHEIQPVQFGGSPTALSNKMAVTPATHQAYSAWWADLADWVRGGQ